MKEERENRSRIYEKYTPLPERSIKSAGIHSVGFYKKGYKPGSAKEYVVKHIFREPLVEVIVSKAIERMPEEMEEALCKLLAEQTAGECMRFLLGPPQPKTRILYSSTGKDLGLYIASSAVAYEKHLYNDSKRAYLEGYAAGLVYNLWLGNRDLHTGQVLLRQDPETRKKRAVFIDFDCSFAQGLSFNAEDIRYLPFVGPHGGYGGQYQPENWLGSYFYTRKDGVKSNLEWHKGDVRTFKNPRFQHDKHRAMLKLFLVPEAVFLWIADQSPIVLQSHFSESILRLLMDRIKGQLISGREEMKRESANIPEFLEYLKNVRPSDIRIIAQEFHAFMSEKNRDVLSEILGQNPDDSFQKLLGDFCELVKSSPFHFSETPDLLELSEDLKQHMKKARDLLLEVIDHFSLNLFFDALCHIANPQVFACPSIPDEPVSGGLDLFLLLDFSLLQTILIQCFPNVEDEASQGMARYLLEQLEDIKNEKIRQLKSEDFKRLCACASTGLARDFSALFASLVKDLKACYQGELEIPSFLFSAENVVRSALEAADQNPWASDLQRYVVKLFSQIDPRSFYRWHLDSKRTPVDWLLEFRVALLGSHDSAFLLSTLVNFAFGSHPTDPIVDADQRIFMSLLKKEALCSLSHLVREVPESEPFELSYRVLEENLRSYEIRDFIGGLRSVTTAVCWQLNLICEWSTKSALDLPADFLERAKNRPITDRHFYFCADLMKEIEERQENFSQEFKIQFEKDIIDAIQPRLDELQIERMGQFLDFLEQLDPTLFQNYSSLFEGYRLDAAFKENCINQESLLRLFKIIDLGVSDPADKKCWAYLIRWTLKAMKRTYVWHHLKDREAVFENLRYTLKPENYACLVQRVAENPCFILFELSQEAWAQKIILQSGYSGAKQEQCFIVYNLLHHLDLQDAQYDTLKERLQTLIFRESSAEFVFHLMAEMDQWAEKKSREVREKVDATISSLFYVLPYSDRVLSRHAIKEEPRPLKEQVSQKHQSLDFVNIFEKTEDLETAFPFFTAVLEASEFSVLCSRLEEEVQRQERLRCEPRFEAQKNSRIEALNRVIEQITKAHNLGNLTWMQVDLALRELARNRSINHHRSDWKNHFRIFKTDSRKKIERISTEFLEPARRGFWARQ